MSRIVVAPVTRENIPDLDYGLRALSSEMGDTHVADLKTLETSFLGVGAAYNAVLAYDANNVVGVLVWSPMFSTTRGGGGLYVSDLWVVSSARGQGTGHKLLAHAISDAENTSGACFVRLAVHRTNPSAFSYYTHVGFEEEADMLSMLLGGSALQRFKSL